MANGESSMTVGEPDDRSAGDVPTSRYAQVKSVVDEALTLLGELSEDDRAVVPDVVSTALSAASEALGGLSECRQAEPFADIILIGDAKGFHLECTHNPSHRY